MERDELEIFLALAQELHFGRTAERLHISTSRVSQAIQKLERRVGSPLFDRTSRRVALTPIGQQLCDDLLPAHRQLRAGLERAIAKARGLSGPLRVGFVGAAAGALGVRTADAIQKDHPEVLVQLREVQTGEAVACLRSGQLDVLLGCLPIQEPDLSTGPVLLSEQWMLAVSTGHSYASRDSITTSDLAEIPILQGPCSLPRDWYQHLASRADSATLTPDSNAPTVTLQEALALVGVGKGAFPVGAHVAGYHRRPDIAYIPIRDAPLLSWGVICLANTPDSRVDAFARAAHAASPRN